MAIGKLTLGKSAARGGLGGVLLRGSRGSVTVGQRPARTPRRGPIDPGASRYLRDAQAAWASLANDDAQAWDDLAANLDPIGDPPEPPPLSGYTLFIRSHAMRSRAGLAPLVTPNAIATAADFPVFIWGELDEPSGSVTVRMLRPWFVSNFGPSRVLVYGSGPRSDAPGGTRIAWRVLGVLDLDGPQPGIDAPPVVLPWPFGGRPGARAWLGAQSVNSGGTTSPRTLWPLVRLQPGHRDSFRLTTPDGPPNGLKVRINSPIGQSALEVTASDGSVSIITPADVGIDGSTVGGVRDFFGQALGWPILSEDPATFSQATATAVPIRLQGISRKVQPIRVQTPT